MSLNSNVPPGLSFFIMVTAASVCKTINRIIGNVSTDVE